MLEDYANIQRVVLACGAIDLHKGIDGLAIIIGDKYKQNPFEKGTLFLFCGRRSDRIKGPLWMGMGFLLLYMRLENGSLFWLHTTAEAADIMEDQFHYLMQRLNPLEPKVKEVNPVKISSSIVQTEKFTRVFFGRYHLRTGIYPMDINSMQTRLVRSRILPQIEQNIFLLNLLQPPD